MVAKESARTAAPIRFSGLDRLGQLLEAQKGMTDSFHLGASLKHACSAVVELLGCLHAMVALQKGDEVVVVAGWTADGAVVTGRPWTVPKEETITYQAILRGEPVQWLTHPLTSAQAPDEPDVLRRLQEHALLNCVFACPLIGSDFRPFGALLVNTGRAEKARSDEVLLASFVATTVAGTLEQNRRWVEAISHRAEVAHEVVAQQVHDTLIQDVSALGMVLDSAKDGPDDFRLLRDAICRALELCGRIESGARRLMLEKAHGYGEKVDLCTRIEEEMARVELAGGARFALSMPGGVDQGDIAAEVRDQIVLLVHEALINAAKHADATSGFVRLKRVGVNICVTIQNNGIRPVDPAAPSRVGTRFGLANLGEMASQLGGRLTYRRDDESGTFTVRQTIPMRGRGYGDYARGDSR